MSVPAFIGNGEGGIHSLSPRQLAHVREVGSALFEGRGLQAFDDGVIDVVHSTQPQDAKGNFNGERQGFQRPTKGSRQGRQGTSGGEGQPRSPHSLRAVIRRDFLDVEALTELRRHYSSVRRWKEVSGTGVWLAVSIFPLGRGGPQADLIIAVPRDPAVFILSWGFWRIDGRVVWIGPKHTNYPCGSICAFPAGSGVWTEGHGIRAYVDRLAEWIMRHLYLDAEGLWPGAHEGLHIYYRLRHTHPHECCTRCRSLNRYEECCRGIDQLEVRDRDRGHFVNLYGCDVGDQRPHSRLFAWAQHMRRHPPSMSRIHPVLRSARGLASNDRI